MYQAFTGGLGGIALAKHGKSRAINAENPHGEKGRGGMAASHLGPSRKGSPCLKDIEPGAVVTLAEMEGPGQINHIWITVDNKTTEADCFVLRDLVIRMYWDDEETPSVESPMGDFFCCGFQTGALTAISRCRLRRKQRSHWKTSMQIKSRRFSIR